VCHIAVDVQQQVAVLHLEWQTKQRFGSPKNVMHAHRNEIQDTAEEPNSWQ
jgi:hypothetical protein